MKTQAEKYPVWLGYMDMPGFERLPITMHAAKDAVLYDVNNVQYIDFLSGVRNVLLGYSEKRISDAIYNQLLTLPFASGSNFGNDVAVALAEQLGQLSKIRNPRVIFHNSGSEAIEASIKLVRQYNFLKKNEKKKIITLKKGYHGQTITALSASGEFFSKEPFQPFTEGFIQVPFPEEVDQVSELEKILKNSNGVAAILIEPLLGNAGVLELPIGYLAEVKRLCIKYDICLIADEVSTGFGRLGEWFLSTDIEPDILVVGKAMTNGYLPLSAVIVSEKIWRDFDGNGFFRHGQTYLNHPVCCRAGLQTISILEEIGAPALCIKKGILVRKMLEPLIKSGKIKTIRGKGLMFAIVFDETIHKKHASIKWLQTAMLNAGFIIGQLDNTVFISPPLIIQDFQVENFVDALEKLLV